MIDDEYLAARIFQCAGDDERMQAFGPIVTDLKSGAAELAEITDVKG